MAASASGAEHKVRPAFLILDMMDEKKYGFIWKHPILANLLVIILVGVIGFYCAYISIALFTKHGQSGVVPSVVNMSYTQAIEKLHDSGFRVDIRDSLYRDDIKPGFVIEQFPQPKSIVKPGRKIFLYINAVHPKEVIIDDDNHPNEYAFKGYSFRQGMAKLEELGFRNIRVVRVLGDTDRIVKILANGKTVRKMQKVAVNSNITVEVCDGRLSDLRDSLRNAEYLENYQGEEEYYSPSGAGEEYTPAYEEQQQQSEEPVYEEQEEIEYL